jgi:hypothetical protein
MWIKVIVLAIISIHIYYIHTMSIYIYLYIYDYLYQCTHIFTHAYVNASPQSSVINARVRMVESCLSGKNSFWAKLSCTVRRTSVEERGEKDCWKLQLYYWWIQIWLLSFSKWDDPVLHLYFSAVNTLPKQKVTRSDGFSSKGTIGATSSPPIGALSSLLAIPNRLYNPMLHDTVHILLGRIMETTHVPSNPDVRPPYRQSEPYFKWGNTINLFSWGLTMRLPPLNNMLNRDIASTYLHKGWISISDKIYLLHGFHTSSTSEMDTYKELNAHISYDIYIHIYIHYTCTDIHIRI